MARHFSVVLSNRRGSNGHKMKDRKSHLNMRKNYCHSDSVLEQVAQRGCRGTFFEVIRNPPGHNPVQRGNHTWHGGWTR